MLKLLKRLIGHTEAQDVLEYALIGAFISCCAVASIRAVGVNVNGVFDAGIASVEAGASGITGGGSDSAGDTGGNGNGNGNGRGNR